MNTTSKSRIVAKCMSLPLLATAGLSACAVGERPHLETAPVITEIDDRVPTPITPYVEDYRSSMPEVSPTKQEALDLAAQATFEIAIILNELCLMGTPGVVCTNLATNQLGTLSEHFAVSFRNNFTDETIVSG